MTGRRGSALGGESLRLAARLTFAMIASVVAFSLAAVVTTIAEPRVPVVVVGALYVLVVLVVGRYGGFAYAVPVGMAGLLAIDWFAIPPTHPLALPSPTNLVTAGTYLSAAVVVGRVAELAGRRAAESEAQRTALADQQAALRRVATAVAHERSMPETFSVVTTEVRALLRLDAAVLLRYDNDRSATVVAISDAANVGLDSGTRVPLERRTTPGQALRELRPGLAAILGDARGRAAAGAPVLVAGRRWGVLLAIRPLGSEQPPPRIEVRLGEFTRLVATAIANTEARSALARLAEEQAALRRVATLVGEGAAPGSVFAAVADELAGVLHVEAAKIIRYETDGTATVVAGHGADLPVVTPSGVGAPIIVDGRVWGAALAGSTGQATLPDDAEDRIARFAELVATAISNAATRAELAASRLRVVAAADETRRRLERDLHDGIQQRLVSIALRLRAADVTVEDVSPELHAELSEVAEAIGGAIDELRELSRGLHPALLSESGLEPALKALARRSAVPVRLAVQVDPSLPDRVQVAAYYVASEALTNVSKHADASRVEIRMERSVEGLDIEIRDDGVGGADPALGSGLVGLNDRVTALGGTLRVTSPAGAGTSLRVSLPVGSPTPVSRSRSES
jgi:signal transduction histidine kinase